MSKSLLDLNVYFKNSESKLLKNLPGFIVSFMKWVVAEKKINRCYKVIGDKYDVAFTRALIEYLHIESEVIFPLEIQNLKRCIFVSNQNIGFTFFIERLSPKI